MKCRSAAAVLLLASVVALVELRVPQVLDGLRAAVKLAVVWFRAGETCRPSLDAGEI